MIRVGIAKSKVHKAGLVTVLEAFLHVTLIFGVIVVKAKFAQQFLRLIAQYVRNTLVHKGELAVDCMARNELVVRIGAHQVIGVWHRGNLKTADGHETAVVCAMAIFTI